MTANHLMLLSTLLLALSSKGAARIGSRSAGKIVTPVPITVIPTAAPTDMTQLEAELDPQYYSIDASLNAFGKGDLDPIPVQTFAPFKPDFTDFPSGAPSEAVRQDSFDAELEQAYDALDALDPSPGGDGSPMTASMEKSSIISDGDMLHTPVDTQDQPTLENDPMMIPFTSTLNESMETDLENEGDWVPDFGNKTSVCAGSMEEALRAVDGNAVCEYFKYGKDSPIQISPDQRLDTCFRRCDDVLGGASACGGGKSCFSTALDSTMAADPMWELPMGFNPFETDPINPSVSVGEGNDEGDSIPDLGDMPSLCAASVEEALKAVQENIICQYFQYGKNASIEIYPDQDLDTCVRRCEQVLGGSSVCNDRELCISTDVEKVQHQIEVNDSAEVDLLNVTVDRESMRAPLSSGATSTQNDGASGVAVLNGIPSVCARSVEEALKAIEKNVLCDYVQYGQGSPVQLAPNQQLSGCFLRCDEILGDVYCGEGKICISTNPPFVEQEMEMASSLGMDTVDLSSMEESAPAEHEPMSSVTPPMVTAQSDGFDDVGERVAQLGSSIHVCAKSLMDAKTKCAEHFMCDYFQSEGGIPKILPDQGDPQCIRRCETALGGVNACASDELCLHLIMGCHA